MPENYFVYPTGKRICNIKHCLSEVIDRENWSYYRYYLNSIIKKILLKSVFQIRGAGYQRLKTYFFCAYIRCSMLNLISWTIPIFTEHPWLVKHVLNGLRWFLSIRNMTSWMIILLFVKNISHQKHSPEMVCLRVMLFHQFFKLYQPMSETNAPTMTNHPKLNNMITSTILFQSKFWQIWKKCNWNIYF